MTHTFSFWRPTWTTAALATITIAAAALLYASAPQLRLASPAQPPSMPTWSASIAGELQRALAVAGQPPAAVRAPGVGVSRLAAAGISIATDTGTTMTLGIPAHGTGQRAGSTTLYDGRGADNVVAVQPTASGVRALVRVAGPAAPQRYRFAVAGATPSLQRGGAVTLRDRDGRELGQISAPWARDAAGRTVPTHYEIDGATLVQVVEHRRGGVSYPVVADPSVWKILKCAGSIIAAAVSIAIPGAKLVQLAKFVKAVGGVREAARLLIGATSKAEKLRAIRLAVGPRSATAVAAALLGIPGIRDNCF